MILRVPSVTGADCSYGSRWQNQKFVVGATHVLHASNPYLINRPRTPIYVLVLSVASMYADITTAQALLHPKPKKVLPAITLMRVKSSR